MVLSKKELGGRIKRAREIKAQKIGGRYTQVMLSDDIGISRSYLGDIEVGKKYPNYELLSKIAQACEVPLSFFDTEGYGKPVKTARESLCMSLNDLSVKAGLSSDTLEKIENNEFVLLKPEEWNVLGSALDMTDVKMSKIVGDDILFRLTSPNFQPLKEQASLVMGAFYETEMILKYGKLIEDNEQNNQLRHLSNVIPFDDNSIIMLPVYGKISAGIPIQATQEEGELYPLDTRLVHSSGYSEKDFFYLRVQGDSMEPTITNGDLVLVRRQPSVDPNEIAVTLCCQEDATIKRVTVAGDKIILNADNPKYPPQIFNFNDCQILGKVLKRVGDVR